MPRLLGVALRSGEKREGDGDGGGGTAEPPPVDVSDRLAGSLSTATWAMILGARMVRVHDVGATARVLGVVAAARAAQRQSGV